MTTEASTAIVAILKELMPFLQAVVAALVILIPLRWQLRSLKSTAEKAAEEAKLTTAKLDDNTITTERIESKVDGQATARTEEIKSLQREMSLLRDFIAAQKETASTLAAATAQKSVISTEPQTLPEAANGDGHVEKQIEKNTRETAKNTASTEKVVNELKDNT